MKKLLILSAAVILTATMYAQNDETAGKNDIAALNDHNNNATKTEKKEKRKKLKKLSGSEVSSLSKAEFYSDFRDLPVSKWERNANFDVATFTKDGQQMQAFYDDNSKLVGTVSNKTFADLPAKGQKIITERYKDYKAGDVIFFDDNELNETDMVLYDEQFDDADNYFVELTKDDKKIIVEVTMGGDVGHFTRMK